MFISSPIVSVLTCFTYIESVADLTVVWLAKADGTHAKFYI